MRNQARVVARGRHSQWLRFGTAGGDPGQADRLLGSVFIDRQIGDRVQRGRGVVLVPRDLVVIVGRGDDVDIAVTVHVRSENAKGSVRSGSDDILCEVLTAIVLVPGDRVVISRRGEHVHIAVTVHVCRKHTESQIRGGADHSFGEVLAAVVFVPRDLVVTF